MRIAMIAITTSSSISVKPGRRTDRGIDSPPVSMEKMRAECPYDWKPGPARNGAAQSGRSKSQYLSSSDRRRGEGYRRVKSGAYEFPSIHRILTASSRDFKILCEIFRRFRDTGGKCAGVSCLAEDMERGLPAVISESAHWRGNGR